MIRNLLCVIFAVSAVYCYGQSDEQKSIFIPAQPGVEQKVTINVSQHSSNDVGVLKDKLLAYQGEILLVHYDESQGTLTVVYNENMKVTELIGEFTKSGFKDVLYPVAKGINETE